MFRFFLHKVAIIRSIVVLAALVSAFVAFIFVRLGEARTDAERRFAERLDLTTHAIDQAFLVASQIARALASYASRLPADQAAHERFLESMLASAVDTSIYGMGIWYEPGIMPFRENGLYGPYVHVDLADRGKIVTTYEWESSEYWYPGQQWYRSLIGLESGSVRTTDFYHDGELVYITTGTSFAREGRTGGVATVGIVLPTLVEMLSAIDFGDMDYFTVFTEQGHVVFQVGADAPIIDESADSHEDVEARVREWYAASGRRAEFFSHRSADVPWRVFAAVDRSRARSSAYAGMVPYASLLVILWLLLSTAIFLRANYVQQRSMSDRLKDENSDLRGEIKRRKKLERELQASRNELDALNHRLSYLAYHDPVTGLLNAQAMLDRMQEIETDEIRTAFLAQLFLENLRELSSIFDRDLVDFILKNLSDRLDAFCPDHVGVYRGAGFSYFLFGTGMDDRSLEVFLEGLSLMFREPVTAFNTRLRLRVRIGVARMEEGLSPGDAINRTVVALSPTESLSSLSYVFYSSRHRERMNRLVFIDSSLMKAGLREELKPVFHPIVDMRTERIVGFEALTRWNCAGHGNIPPSDFIPLAEENGVIIEIGWFIMEQTLDALADDGALGTGDWFISVNVSPLQFLEVDFVENLERLVEARLVDRNRLKIEITESAISAMEETFWKTSRLLLERGFRFAIDDFGTGQSSLSRLSGFNFDTIKIDRGFVTDIATSERNVKLVRSILSLSASLGALAIAEGIETTEQRDILLGEGCFLAQGYFYHKPLGIEGLRTVLS